MTVFEAALNVAKAFAVLFTCGFLTTLGVGAACRIMKWAPINLTVNNHTHHHNEG